MGGLLALACVLPACAADLHYGVKAGVPITEYFETGAMAGRVSSAHYTAATRRYVAGAAVGAWFTPHLGLEIDALYQRVGYVGYTFQVGGGSLIDAAYDAKGNSFDFPLLAKYRFARHRVQPFAAAGAVLRYIGPVHATGATIINDPFGTDTRREPIDTDRPSDLRKRTYPGLTAAGGLEFTPARMRLTAEVRFIWHTANIAAPGGLLRFPTNEITFLVGIAP